MGDKKRYDALKAMGRCVRCGKNRADDGYTTCLVCRMDIREKGETHSEESKARHKKWLNRRRDVLYAFGVCVTCGKRDSEKGSSMCGRCKAKSRIRHHESNLKKGIMPREVMWDGKHCAFCGSTELVLGKKTCLKHYEIARNNMLYARSQRKEETNWFEKATKSTLGGDEKMKKTRLRWLSEMEMKYFCLQYNDKLRYARQHSDDTAKEYMRDVNLIETALHIVTDTATYEFLKKHVTSRHMPYERLGAVPMGRKQFYEMRLRFFELLAWIR